MNDLVEGIEGTLGKFAEDTKLKRAASTPECCAAIQKDLERLKRWAEEPFEIQHKQVWGLARWQE